MELDSLSMVSDSLSVVLQNLQGSQALEILQNLPPSAFESSIFVKSMAIIGIFFVPFIAIISIIWFILSYKQKQNKMKAELMVKAIEHGQTIPNNFFETKEKKNSLKKGIIWTSVGLGIILFFVIIGFTGNKNAFSGMAIGIIPTFVGIGHLLYHSLDKKAKKEENDGDK